MADAIVIQIADAIVSILNTSLGSGPYGEAYGEGEPFTAERAEAPITEMSELETLQVSVIPGMLVTAIWDLSKRLVFDCEIGVWVQRRTDLLIQETDPLRLLVEQIITLFLSQNQQIGIPSGIARCIRAETRTLPTPEILDVTRVFTTGIFFTFRKTQ